MGLHRQYPHLQRLVRRGLAGLHAIDLHAIDFVGEVGQGTVDLQGFCRHQRGEVRGANCRIDIQTGSPQRYLSVIEIHLASGTGKAEFAAGRDHLFHGDALVAAGMAGADGVPLESDVGVLRRARLDHGAAGSGQVRLGLPHQWAPLEGHRLQRRQRHRPALRARSWLNPGRQGGQALVQPLHRGTLRAGIPGIVGWQLKGGHVCAGDVAGDRYAVAIPFPWLPTLRRGQGQYLGGGPHNIACGPDDRILGQACRGKPEYRQRGGNTGRSRLRKAPARSRRCPPHAPPVV